MSVKNRLRLAFSLLLVILFIGSAGFHYLEGWSWFDGFYMTLTTMATVGYGEIHPLSKAGRAFNSFVILSSVIVWAFTIATFSQTLLEFELGKVLGRRRMERELAKLSSHTIICGAGRVGRSVARELKAHDERCVFIEKDEKRAQWAFDEKIPVILGDASSEENLGRAHIEQARGLVAAVSSDAENLYIVLTARGLRPDLKIIARASEEEATSKLLRAGASQVLSPYFFVGRRIAHLLLRPNVLDFIDAAFGAGRLDVEIEEIVIGEGSVLAGKSLATSAIHQQAGVIVLGLKPAGGEMIFNPPPDRIVRPGDCLIVIGAEAQLKQIEAVAASSTVAK